MTGGMPAIIDPFRLADRGASLQGTLSLAQLPRLREICTELDKQLRVDLGFSRSDLGVVEMAGSLIGELELTCQRCLEPMTLPLALNIRVNFLRREDSQELAANLDTISVDETINFYRLVEDEVLLAIPMIPKHEKGDCPAMKYINGAAKTVEKTDKPFAVLEQIKRKH